MSRRRYHSLFVKDNSDECCDCYGEGCTLGMRMKTPMELLETDDNETNVRDAIDCKRCRGSGRVPSPDFQELIAYIKEWT